MKSYKFTLIFKNITKQNQCLMYSKNYCLYGASCDAAINSVKQRNKKRFTILKSPHINKVAQESFDMSTFLCQWDIYSFQKLKHIICLKKVRNNLFSNLYMKVQVFLQKKNQSHIWLNPNNYYNEKEKKSKNRYNYKKNVVFEGTKNFIKVFDTFGEKKRSNYFF